MKKYELIIFDLDGTIADTSEGILNSIRYVQKKMNLPEISLEKMYSHIGPPMEESYRRNFNLSGADLKKAIKLHKEYAVERGYKEISIYDGILELFTQLKNSGKKVAVATLKAYTTAVKIFKSVNILDEFDYIAGVDVNNPQTKAQLIMQCINDIDMEKSKTVLVGDSLYDAIGAAEVGIDFIAVTYGYGFKNKKDIDGYRCVEVCENVESLKKILL